MFKKSLKLLKRNLMFWWQRKTRGWSDDECWDLDITFIKWLNSRFKQFKKDALKAVDLEYHKFTYLDVEYTQLELIDMIILKTNKILKTDFVDEEYFNTVDEVLDIFKIIWASMWW